MFLSPAVIKNREPAPASLGSRKKLDDPEAGRVLGDVEVQESGDELAYQLLRDTCN